MERYTTTSAVIRGEYRVFPTTTERCLKAIDKLGRYEDEFENPTSLDDKTVELWETKVIKHAHPQDRKRSMSQLLFYMLRSGK